MLPLSLGMSHLLLQLTEGDCIFPDAVLLRTGKSHLGLVSVIYFFYQVQAVLVKSRDQK